MKRMTSDQQKEAMELLGAARNEIMNLRERLAAAEIKARAFDTMERFAQLTMGNSSQGFGIDNSWQIQRFMNEVNNPPQQAPAQVDD